MEAYEKRLESEGAQGRRQLAILRLLGLFDRPASAGCLAALRRSPPIPGWTEALFEEPSGWRAWFKRPSPIGEEVWRVSLSLLADAGRIQVNGGEVEAQPLLRESFAQRLQEDGAAWREAHGRLFEFLCVSTEFRPDTLAGLQPLYQAVYHGCHAGRQREACYEVYVGRILRGTGKDGFYSTRKLGAFGADLGAIACFFETPWSRVAASLPEAGQAWLLSQAAFCLRSLGRLREALEPMRAGLERAVRDENWKTASALAGNLSELGLTLGDVKAAAADAEQSLVFADRCGDAVQRLGMLTSLADARHQAGEEEAALALFREAERLQSSGQPEHPLLYSLQGFRYWELLLARAERAAGSGRDAGALGRQEECDDEVERRATQALKVAEENHWLLDIALGHLMLGRARLYRAILAGRELQAATEAEAEIEEAVAGLRAAGQVLYLPRGLLTRSWLRFVTGDMEGAQADLDEAQEIAERGGMRLHLADVALYRARFFGDRAALAEARRLVVECGYGRRWPEIADLETRLGSMPEP